MFFGFFLTFALMKRKFLIAAPASGSGKTTVARGLMALFSAQGYRVQPFKCGPDYIDTKFHAAVCGRPSINLDTFMASKAHVKELFARYAAESDVCVVEGMMGLFDGYDRDRGSTAEVASVLGLPVVLVVDARSAAYSMAALLQGFLGFRSDVNIAGVIFNKVGSPRHAAMLRQVCDDLQTECLGCLPKSAQLEVGSRYLGLDFSAGNSLSDARQWLGQHIAYGRLLELGGEDVAADACTERQTAPPATCPGHVLVARNEESFSFIYQETLDGFGRVSFFNPETQIPDFHDVDMLYLPGGYPEKHLHALVAAEATRHAIRDFALGGGHVVAECGGMMYLCEAIVTDEGVFPMCGVLPYSISARRADRKLSLGYRRFVLDGREYRGHEFHYTQFAGTALPASAAQVFNARNERVDTPVIRQGNVLASYTHLYFHDLSFLGA